MASKTREKIVETARQLFNRLHYDNVTTAMLAEAVGISEGNLWYHFKTKRDLLEAITVEFLEKSMSQRPLSLDEDDVIGSYVGYIELIAVELREFAFLYRDQAAYGAHTELLTRHLPDIYAGAISKFSAFFRAMRDQGMMQIEEDEIEDLATNIVIIIRYKLEYLRESGQAARQVQPSAAPGVRQHLTLFSHRLTPSAKAELERRIGALASDGLKNRDACVM